MLLRLKDALVLLRAIHSEMKIMALNTAALQAVVAELVPNVRKLIAIVSAGPAVDPADQTVIDNVTNALTALDTEVKAVPTPPAS